MMNKGITGYRGVELIYTLSVRRGSTVPNPVACTGALTYRLSTKEGVEGILPAVPQVTLRTRTNTTWYELDRWTLRGKGIPFKVGASASAPSTTTARSATTAPSECIEVDVANLPPPSPVVAVDRSRAPGTKPATGGVGDLFKAEASASGPSPTPPPPLHSHRSPASLG